ncbi:MAG TPA: non-ribosomal peptide synthetase, partial [Pyrinomonadaceae bacterium]
PLLSEEERHQIVVGWNQTQADCEALPVQEQFEQQAVNTPDAIAVADPNGFVTYAELDRRSNQLARYLRNCGVGPEKMVALYLPRSLKFVEAALAVLKTGGAYLPLDVNSPAERLRLMIDDAGVVAVLSESSLEEKLQQVSATVIGVDAVYEQVERESTKPLRGGAGESNLAYVIYTSGSTGRPKGVQITHQGLANLVQWHQQCFGVAPEDRATLLASPAFDASVWELWPYLIAGASLHVPEPETEYSPALIQQWLVQNGITITFVPTPLADSMMTMAWPKHSSLHTMLTGGDKLHQYPSEGHGFKLVNNYGPTEASVVATSGLITAKDRSGSPPVIGRPIANTQVYVLDSFFGPVPAGVPGQLVLTGHGLMRGYVGRPDLTAERLRPNPFSTNPGGRLYLTGDLVRHLRDGRLEFLGRIDRQVKLRGLRIEPGEIETALCEHPNVQKAAVETDESLSRLIAYVVCEPGSTDTDSDLKEHLQRRVPDYMVPALYVRLEELPLTESGKIDRARLPKVEAGAENGRKAEFHPRNSAEEVLIDIWRDVLGVEAVGVHDDFFALGGHSLLAARAATRVRERLGVEVGVRQLFERPTVAGLSALVQLKTPQQTVMPGISRLSRDSYRATALGGQVMPQKRTKGTND